MAHLLRYSEWQGADNYWHCNDVEDLANGSGYWWLPARMMQITPAEFLNWLFNQDFKPDNFYFNKEKCLCFWSWKDQSQMRKYKNYINKLARQKNFLVC